MRVRWMKRRKIGQSFLSEVGLVRSCIAKTIAVPRA